MKFGLFYLGSYVNLVLSALLVAVLYFGGWDFPIPLELISGWLGISPSNPVLQVVTALTGRKRGGSLAANVRHSRP